MKAHLPDELLAMIFERLSPRMLRRVRRLNHQWSRFITPLVFERIHASLLPWSLVKLQALSQSQLAEHVKAIDFHTEQLREPDKYPYRGRLSSSLTKEQIYQGWSAYKACYTRPIRHFGQREREQ